MARTRRGEGPGQCCAQSSPPQLPLPSAPGVRALNAQHAAGPSARGRLPENNAQTEVDTSALAGQPRWFPVRSRWDAPTCPHSYCDMIRAENHKETLKPQMVRYAVAHSISAASRQVHGEPSQAVTDYRRPGRLAVVCPKALTGLRDWSRHVLRPGSDRSRQRQCKSESGYEESCLRGPRTNRNQEVQVASVHPAVAVLLAFASMPVFPRKEVGQGRTVVGWEGTDEGRKCLQKHGLGLFAPGGGRFGGNVGGRSR